MKNLKTILAICTVAVMIASCETEGPQGPAGTPGKDGKDGNANVNTFNYTITSWGFDGNYWYADFAPSISSAAISDGAVMGYIYTSSGWTSLPYLYYVGGGVTQYYRSFFSQNNFLIQIRLSDGSTPTSAQNLLSTPRDVKVVVIPGRLANPNVNLNSYEEVKAAYNLKD